MAWAYFSRSQFDTAPEAKGDVAEKPRDERNEQEFYTELFTKNPGWSVPFPNPDEASRWGKICIFLSQIASQQPRGSVLRILDVGCGRGWLTRQASLFGICEGVDPVPAPVALARQYFPDLTFKVGTLHDVIASPHFRPFDVAIASEVIEHVPEQESFIRALDSCLAPTGHAIVTTPRGEFYRRWKRTNIGQPVERWLTERRLRNLFVRRGFHVVAHDRIYAPLGSLSLAHRICASRKINRIVTETRCECAQKGLQYALGIYQVWWFQKTAGRHP